MPKFNSTKNWKRPNRPNILGMSTPHRIKCNRMRTMPVSNESFASTWPTWNTTCLDWIRMQRSSCHCRPLHWHCSSRILRREWRRRRRNSRRDTLRVQSSNFCRYKSRWSPNDDHVLSLKIFSRFFVSGGQCLVSAQFLHAIPAGLTENDAWIPVAVRCGHFDEIASRIVSQKYRITTARCDHAHSDHSTDR